MPMSRSWMRCCFVAVTTVHLSACGDGRVEPTVPVSTVTSPEAAAIHAELFRKGVEKVTEGVHVAIGYSLANSILLEGDDGVVIVDTLESSGRAEEVFAAFREITDKPVKAVILTHNHADHIFGSAVFTGGNAEIPVFAHATTAEYIGKIVSVVSDATYVRSMRMFGQLLPKTDVPHAGIGPGLDYHPDQMALQWPTETFEDEREIEVAGIRMRLIHAPGETPDQICVWLPDTKVLLPADNVYQAFPNLYTIRGTEYRDVMKWVDTIDMMRGLGAEFLVPSHTRPLAGREAIEEMLTAYRDAIQFVHDQTVRGMNKGKTAAELAVEIRLPPHLEFHPWLQPYYGTVPWSVKGIYDGYLGWFDGNAATLEPVAPGDRSQKWADAFSAGLSLPEQAKAAVQSGDFAWAAELADHWVRLEPDNVDARQVLAAAFDGLAQKQTSPNGNNYFLSQAAELRGKLDIEPTDKSLIPDSFIEGLPIDRFMHALAVRLRAEDTLDVNELAQFRFTDIGKDYTVHIRRGVAEIRARTVDTPDLLITSTTTAWKKLATRKLGAAQALLTGDLHIEGGVLAMNRFMGYFELN